METTAESGEGAANSDTDIFLLAKGDVTKPEDSEKTKLDLKEGLDTMTKQFFTRKFSTTSSLYVKTTLHFPATNQQLLCIAAILQSHIAEHVKMSAMKVDHLVDDLMSFVNEVKIMDDSSWLPNHSFGLGDGISIEDNSNMSEELRTYIEEGKVPRLIEIVSFLDYLFNQACKYSPCCNIIALMYVNRLIASYKMNITYANWKLIWVSVLNLTVKIWDETSVSKSEIQNLLPNLNGVAWGRLEMFILHAIRFQIKVKPSVYAEYYFNLRNVLTTITSVETETTEVFEALSVVKAKRIDVINSTFKERMIKKYQKKRLKKMGGISSPSQSIADASIMKMEAKESPIWGGSASADSSPLATSAFRRLSMTPLTENSGILLEKGNNTFEDVTRKSNTSRMVLI